MNVNGYTCSCSGTVKRTTGSISTDDTEQKRDFKIIHGEENKIEIRSVNMCTVDCRSRCCVRPSEWVFVSEANKPFTKLNVFYNGTLSLLPILLNESKAERKKRRKSKFGNHGVSRTFVESKKKKKHEKSLPVLCECNELLSTVLLSSSTRYTITAMRKRIFVPFFFARISYFVWSKSGA